MIRILLATAALGVQLANWAYSAPPPQPSPAPGSALRAADLRVASIAYKLTLGARSVCRPDVPLTGLLLHHLAEYEIADRTLAIERYQVDRGPGILAVVPDSPAARAGLVAGDVLLSVNGIAFTSPGKIAAEAKRKTQRKLIEASEMQLENQLRLGDARLLILRKGKEMEVALSSIPACPGRVRLARSTQVNAFADGRYVTVTTALLDFLRSDDELAVVLAHEMSHNILGHQELLDAEGVPRRGMLRKIGKNAERVWATEAEADRVSIPIIWRSGFDVGAAIPFWRRLLAKYDWLPQIFRTHPSLRVRERIVREAIAALPTPPPSN